MGRRNSNVRAQLRSGKTQYQAGIGVRYGIAQTDSLGAFFNQLGRAFAEHIPEIEVTNERTAASTFVEGFKLYDSPDKTGITVIERRLTGRVADRQRQRWGKSDFGRLRGELKDELGKQREKHIARLEEMGVSAGQLTLQLDGVAVVGEENRSRKLALLPAGWERADVTYLDSLYEEARDILGGEVKGFQGNQLTQVVDADSRKHPLPGEEPVVREYVPHLTVCRIGRAASGVQFEACVDSLRQIVSDGLEVELAELQIYDYQPDYR